MNFMEKGDLYEHLAAIEHQRWADWQQYVFDQCRRSDRVAGMLVIPNALEERWQRQIDTPYEQWSEEDKDKDREQVDRYWPFIAPLLTRAKSGCSKNFQMDLKTILCMLSSGVESEHIARYIRIYMLKDDDRRPC